MSTFSVPIVEISKFGKHPNADTLSIITIDGCPCIFKTQDFKAGDLAIYIPVDAVIQEDSDVGRRVASFVKFKNGLHRVKALKLRQIFSMGLLLPIGDLFLSLPPVETDVAGLLGIMKYEEPEEISMGGQQERDPGLMPVYDIENYRKFGNVFTSDMEVCVTEKIHGTNFRVIHDGERLWVGSHRTWKKPGDENLWNRIVREYDLEAKLAAHPRYGLYGEVYGDVQDLKYGAKPGELKLAIFDVYVVDQKLGSYFLPFHEMVNFCNKLELPTVPILYVGPHSQEVIKSLVSGTSQLADQIREGIVVKTTKQAWDRNIGRMILKYVSEEYLLRKNGTEHH